MIHLALLIRPPLISNTILSLVGGLYISKKKKKRKTHAKLLEVHSFLLLKKFLQNDLFVSDSLLSLLIHCLSRYSQKRCWNKMAHTASLCKWRTGRSRSTILANSDKIYQSGTLLSSRSCSSLFSRYTARSYILTSAPWRPLLWIRLSLRQLALLKES